MPLLPLEEFVYPEDLLNTSEGQPSQSVSWWVLHTRPRTEKALTRRLLKYEIPFFLPISKRQWRNRGRLHCSFLPLFPGYVFLQGDSQSVFRTLETNLVARVLSVADQNQLHADLARVYRLICNGQSLAPEDRLLPGTQVEITAGPLTGLEGKILRRGKQLKFVIEVQFLQRGVSVEIESWMFEPRSSPRPLASASA